MTLLRLVVGALGCAAITACGALDRRPSAGKPHAVDRSSENSRPPTKGAPDVPPDPTVLHLKSGEQRTTFRWGKDSDSAPEPVGRVLHGEDAKREMSARAQMVAATETAISDGLITLRFTYTDGCGGAVKSGQGRETQFEFRPTK